MSKRRKDVIGLTIVLCIASLCTGQIFNAKFTHKTKTQSKGLSEYENDVFFKPTKWNDPRCSESTWVFERDLKYLNVLFDAWAFLTRLKILLLFLYRLYIEQKVLKIKILTSPAPGLTLSLSYSPQVSLLLLLLSVACIRRYTIINHKSDKNLKRYLPDFYNQTPFDRATNLYWLVVFTGSGRPIDLCPPTTLIIFNY